MSSNYASSLSPYPNKGILGQAEIEDSNDQVLEKCDFLFELIEKSDHIVAITGAGLSTSCGIPDFRGPKGIWTLEKKGLKPETDISFNEAQPSFTHFALTRLAQMGKIKFIVSQNIDGLHMKSGFPVNRLAEVHGNMFTLKCNSCHSKFLMNTCSPTIGLKSTKIKCSRPKAKGFCRGVLFDTILDWEDELPSEEMSKSELNCKKSDLILCLGTSLQIMPVGNYPLLTKKNNGKIVIINLQKTRLDNQADLVIHARLDIIFENLVKKMSLEVPREIRINLNLENDQENSLLIKTSSYVVDHACSKDD
ncbi:NAD-dependent deacetylase sirtuin-6-like [Brachionus plicatilis]|uniref:protein acetyllysine N-acetyltransferase n=1 Tax=Brachionus plicatilis TaxID=10195 RepID=A0A3M7QN53_BRAPC|nr:NAD-dependent deacetylase sirtuin-6-like [Brachionus plicatilis]